MHDNYLCERGTTNALESYSKILKSLGHDVSIAFESYNASNIPEVVTRLAANFELLPYESFSRLAEVQSHFDVAYFIKSGRRDGRNFKEIPSLIHCVFQEYDPHGSSYVYVSEWLARKLRSERYRISRTSKGIRAQLQGCHNALSFDYLPHVVDVASRPKIDYELFGLTDQHFIVLRYGGYDTFDIPWVQQELLHFIKMNSSAVAILVNTKPFCKHERIIHLPRFTNAIERDRLLASCDVFIHGRSRGESFGMAIVEAMQANCAVLACAEGVDQNHVELLKGSGALYSSRADLRLKLAAEINGASLIQKPLLSSRGNEFRPSAIAPKLISLIEAIL